MGIWSFLFPTADDHLRIARALMKEGKYEKARGHLMRCSSPEAEGLYDECSAIIEKTDRETQKRRLAADGFHGWRIEVNVASAKRKRELESLVAKEIERAGLDLGMPDIDQDELKAAVARAQRKARPGGRDAGTIKLVRAEKE